MEVMTHRIKLSPKAHASQCKHSCKQTSEAIVAHNLTVCLVARLFTVGEGGRCELQASAPDETFSFIPCLVNYCSTNPLNFGAR